MALHLQTLEVLLAQLPFILVIAVFLLLVGLPSVVFGQIYPQKRVYFFLRSRSVDEHAIIFECDENLADSFVFIFSEFISYFCEWFIEKRLYFQR